jgi:hypothetical protein
MKTMKSKKNPKKLSKNHKLTKFTKKNLKKHTKKQIARKSKNNYTKKYVGGLKTPLQWWRDRKAAKEKIKKARKDEAARLVSSGTVRNYPNPLFKPTGQTPTDQNTTSTSSFASGASRSSSSPEINVVMFNPVETGTDPTNTNGPPQRPANANNPRLLLDIAPITNASIMTVKKKLIIDDINLRTDYNIFDMNKVPKFIFDDLNYKNNNNTRQKNKELDDYLDSLDNLNKINLYLDREYEKYSNSNLNSKLPSIDHIIENKIKELSDFINHSQKLSKYFEDKKKYKLLLVLEILSIIKIEIYLNKYTQILNTKFVSDMVFSLYFNKIDKNNENRTKKHQEKYELAKKLTKKLLLLLLDYDPIKYNFLNYQDIGELQGYVPPRPPRPPRPTTAKRSTTPNGSNKELLNSYVSGNKLNAPNQANAQNGPESNGNNGNNGLPGSNGNNGLPGSNGNNGLPGSNGNNGSPELNEEEV